MSKLFKRILALVGWGFDPISPVWREMSKLPVIREQVTEEQEHWDGHGFTSS